RKCRGTLQFHRLFKCFPRLARRINDERPSDSVSDKLPGVRNAARHEHARTRSAGNGLVTDPETVLSAQNVHHLVAVTMEVERCRGALWSYLLERHHALSGLPVL